MNLNAAVLSNSGEDWSIWTAGIMTDSNVRDMFITAVQKTAADGLSSQPFGDWYETVDGKPEGFKARPVVGGHRKLLRYVSPPILPTPCSPRNSRAGMSFIFYRSFDLITEHLLSTL